ncbi:MAG: hypothetical protein ABII26_02625 [Pseudomonadota bacterium]
MKDREKIERLKIILENAKALAKCEDPAVDVRGTQIAVISQAVLALLSPEDALEKLLEYE